LARASIFFSYARSDGESLALKLVTDLRNAGIDVWMDQSNIQPGNRWDLEVEKALNNASCILFIATKKSTVSANVLDEVYYALEKNKKVIPVMADECTLPFRLRRLQFIDFTYDYNVGFNQLQTTLTANENEQGLVLSINQKEPPATTKKVVDKGASDEQPTSLRVVGILFILAAGLIGLLVQHPTKAQYFILYALTGVGIAFLLVKSANNLRFGLKPGM
jgi:hypothetical protein